MKGWDWMALQPGVCSCIPHPSSSVLPFCSFPRSTHPDAGPATTGDPSGRLKVQVLGPRLRPTNPEPQARGMAAPLEPQDQTSGEGEGLLIVKVEDSSWEQESAQHEDSRDSEACRQRFRQFCYGDVHGPHEAFSQLWELCCRWLRPELRTKEQILELLVLEQFLTVLPGEIQGWVREQHPGSGEEAVALVEDLQKQPLKAWPQDVPSEEAEPEAAGQGSQAKGPPLMVGARRRPSVPQEQHSHSAQPPALLKEGHTRETTDTCFVSGVHGPVALGDIPFYFSREEWGTLDPAQRDLFWDIKRENSRNTTLGLGLKGQNEKSRLEEVVPVLPGQTGSDVTVSWSPEEAETWESENRPRAALGPVVGAARRPPLAGASSGTWQPRSHTAAGSVESASAGVRTWRGTSARTRARSRTSAPSATRASAAPRTWCATKACTRARSPSPVPSAARASAAAPTWLTTSASTRARSLSAAATAARASRCAPTCWTIGVCTPVSGPLAAESATRASSSVRTSSRIRACTPRWPSPWGEQPAWPETWGRPSHGTSYFIHHWDSPSICGHLLGCPRDPRVPHTRSSPALLGCEDLPSTQRERKPPSRPLILSSFPLLRLAFLFPSSFWSPNTFLTGAAGWRGLRSRSLPRSPRASFDCVALWPPPSGVGP
uniref:SCAN box domain-containing protein n=1 Tax=Macaca fascicularis TaxID=9541 RepID=A0A2K5V2G0_MACFA